MIVKGTDGTIERAVRHFVPSVGSYFVGHDGIFQTKLGERQQKPSVPSYFSSPGANDGSFSRHCGYKNVFASVEISFNNIVASAWKKFLNRRCELYRRRSLSVAVVYCSIR